jgi:hypothetical protein
MARISVAGNAASAQWKWNLAQFTSGRAVLDAADGITNCQRPPCRMHGGRGEYSQPYVVTTDT